MSTLHTVNKSPFEKNALKSCLGHLCSGDAVLMIEDGVFGARRGLRRHPWCRLRCKAVKFMRSDPTWLREASSRRM